MTALYTFTFSRQVRRASTSEFSAVHSRCRRVGQDKTRPRHADRAKDWGYHGCVPTFPSTHWSAITDLAGSDGGARYAAIEEFLGLYHKPLEAFLAWRYSGLRFDEREDILQGFIADRLLAQTLYQRAVDRAECFRPYLRQSLANYVADYYRAHARNLPTLPAGGLDAASPSTADPFDQEWAKTVIVEALLRLRRECFDTGRVLIWDIFDLRIRRPIYHQQAAVRFSELAKRFGRSEHELRNLLVTAKRMMHRYLIEVVRGYTTSDAQALQEIRDLQAIASECPSEVPPP